MKTDEKIRELLSKKITKQDLKDLVIIAKREFYEDVEESISETATHHIGL